MVALSYISIGIHVAGGSGRDEPYFSMYGTNKYICMCSIRLPFFSASKIYLLKTTQSALIFLLRNVQYVFNYLYAIPKNILNKIVEKNHNLQPKFQQLKSAT